MCARPDSNLGPLLSPGKYLPSGKLLTSRWQAASSARRAQDLTHCKHIGFMSPTKPSSRVAKTSAKKRVLGDVYAPACPSRNILEHVTSRWGVLVLVALLEGTHRFSELRRKVSGVSEKMLAQTLQTLEADGFVHREVFPEIPPRVEYSLTALGEEAAVHVRTLVSWIEGNLSRVLSARERRR